MTSSNHKRINLEIGRTEASSDPFVAAVRATRMPMIITDPNRSDNPIIFANNAFSNLTGYERDEIVGRNCRFLQGPETNRQDVDRIRDAIERRVPIEIELLNHKKSGEVFWNRLLISPVFGEDGALTYFFASQFDVTLERERLVRLQKDRDALELEVEQRSRELTRAEDRLRFMLKAGRFGAWSLTLPERRLVTSDLCKENFGRAQHEPFTYDQLLASILPTDRARMEAAVRESIIGHSDYDIEYRIKTPAGEVRWVQIRGQTHYRADGEPLSMAGVSIDITERKRSEEHRALLADELNHRVKNSMATMQSIAYQTLRNASSLDQAQSVIEARLHSMSMAHDVLTRESWEGANLKELADSAIQPFRVQSRQRFKIGGPDLKVPPRMALAFTMALHELSTNAVKYGALSNDIGKVFINWEVRDGSDSAVLRIEWHEVDGPLVTPPKRSGFGTRLIERALTAEMGGTAKIDYLPKGVVFTVEAPLPATDASPARWR